MDLIKKTNIDFTSRRGVFFTVSLVINVVGLILVAILGVDMGIDFMGGTELAVKFRNNTATIETVRNSVGDVGFQGAEIKTFGKSGEFLVRVKEIRPGTEVAASVVTHLGKDFPTDQIELIKSETIQPKVSAELARDSTIALVAAFLIMLIYIAFRFDYVSGLGAIVSLLHDVLMAFVISVLFHKTGLLNLELSINSVAAYLTILGYSINDKVVVFDRIRENKEKHKAMRLTELINLSINETLSRTIITGVSVLVALLVLVFFGGEVLEGFAFTMFIGIVIGTYSSIFIASSFVIWYTDRVQHKRIGAISDARV